MTMNEMEKYLRSCRSEFWQKVFRAELEYLLPHLIAGAKVLSVGCGPAIIEKTLNAHGINVTGLDVSREALAYAPDTVRTVAGRAEDMPFADSAFDAVIFVASLQFVQDYKKAVAETTRVLRPQGLFIALLLNPDSGFFKRKLRNADSYVRKMKHTNLKKIENTVAERYQVQTEYYLGIMDDNRLFSTREPADAVLYIIKGTKK